MVLHFLHDAIGLKDSRHLSIQSEVKPKPIVTRSHAFSRALRQPHVITSSFDWFNVLSVSYVIGQSNYFGFGFTTLKRKPLYPPFEQLGPESGQAMKLDEEGRLVGLKTTLKRVSYRKRLRSKERMLQMSTISLIWNPKCIERGLR